MNAKCTNCGADMGVTQSDNWAMYCREEACRQAFMESVIAEATKPKRKRKSKA